MELSIRTRSVEITDDLRDLICRRLKFALDVFGDRVTRASVYLADVNGPRGGVDKACHLAVAVCGIGDVFVRETGFTAEAAVTLVMRRVKYLVSEALRQSQRPATESIRRTAA
jgi:putative sigma-54 modulation protein